MKRFTRNRSRWIAAALAAAMLPAADSARAELIYQIEAESDNWIQRDGSTKDGESETLAVKIAAAAGTSTNRRAYTRFNLAGTNPDLAESATFSMYLESFSGGGTGMGMEVWGLNSGATGFGWDESTINDANAPANDTSGFGFTSDATVIGQNFVTPGNVSSVTMGSLSPFIQADGTATFMATGYISERFGTYSSSESTTNRGPTLTFTSTTPVPVNSIDNILGERQSNAPTAGYYPDDTTNGTIGVSGSAASSARENNQIVIGILLPTIKGDVLSATLSMDKTTDRFDSGNAFDLDLYGLLTANPDGSGTTFFYEGENDPNGSVLQIEDDFMTSGQADGSNSSANVTAFIQALYNEDGTPIQSEVFFRLTPDRNLSLTFIDRIVVDLTSINLQIVANGIPAPGALPAGLTLLGLAATRRRRR